MASFDGGKIKVIGLNPDMIRTAMEGAGYVQDGTPEGDWAVKMGTQVLAVAEDYDSAVVLWNALRGAGIQGHVHVEEIRGKGNHNG